ncbi:MAG: CocE/NonD family hydrolase [Intestinimonas sp.]
MGSDGFETCASADETAAFASVVRWLAGDEGVKAYSDKNSGVEVKADWSNGNVAMSGQSYAGSTASPWPLPVWRLKTIVPPGRHRKLV